MTCRLCEIRVKDWHGDDPKCAFESGTFSEDNWNCATTIAIRTLVQQRDSWCCIYDQSYAMIPVADAIGDDDDGTAPYDVLLVSWYKNRGRTERMLLWSSDTNPAVPTLEQIEKIIEHEKDRVHLQLYLKLIGALC